MAALPLTSEMRATMADDKKEIDRKSSEYLDLLKAVLAGGAQSAGQAIALADAVLNKLNGVEDKKEGDVPEGTKYEPHNPNLDPALPQTSDPSKPTGQDEGAPKQDDDNKDAYQGADKEPGEENKDPAIDAPADPAQPQQPAPPVADPAVDPAKEEDKPEQVDDQPKIF